MYRTNLKSVASPIPELAIKVLGRVANPKSWGWEGRRGSEMVPLERALVSSYGRSIVTFPLSLRVSEILPLFVLQHATFSTPHL